MNPKAKNLTGHKIRFFRNQRGWTQEALAESLQKMGIPITRHIIANIETQRSPVTDCQLAFIAKALQVPLLSFFFDDADLADLGSTVGVKPPSVKPHHNRHRKRSVPNSITQMTHKIRKFAKRLLARTLAC